MKNVIEEIKQKIEQETESLKYFPLNERLKKIDLIADSVDIEYCRKYDLALQLAEAQLSELQSQMEEEKKKAVIEFGRWAANEFVIGIDGYYYDKEDISQTDSFTSEELYNKFKSPTQSIEGK